MGGSQREGRDPEQGQRWVRSISEACAVWPWASERPSLSLGSLQTSGAVTGRRDKTQEALHESTQHAVLRLAARLCLTLCNPMDCSPPGSSVHGVLQVRILEWGAMACSRGSSQTQGSNPGLPHCRRILYHLSHQGSPKVLNTTTVGTGVDAQ